MLLSRYNDLNYVMELDINYGIRLLKKAYEGNNEELLMQRWLLHYEKEMSFKEFKDALMNKTNSSDKTEQEILTEVQDIINTFNKEVK